MEKIIKKRYYIAFILSLCLVVSAIVTLHSYYNLQDIIQAPSESWGRATSLGVSNLYKKQPSVLVNDQYAEILAANKTDFTTIKIDRVTREVYSDTLKIKDVESYKVKQFAWDINNIYFIADNNLYYASKNSAGGYSAKLKIADNINDFDLLEQEGKTSVLAVGKDGIALYTQDGKGFSQVGETYDIGTLTGVSSMIDKNGDIHIAAFFDKNSIQFEVHYITYKQNKWSTVGSKVEKTLSESWGINNIEIALDDTDAYIFYEMVKWDQRGVSARMHYETIPLALEKAPLEFERLFLTKADENNSNAYLNESRTLKTQGTEVKLTVVRDSYDKKHGSGFSGYIVTMDNGQIKDVTRTTRNQRFLTNSAYINHKGDDILVYLDAAGSFNYEAFYTETGKNYIAGSAKASYNDYSTALMNTVPGYVSTLLLAIIKFTVYFPAILWFLAIEFLEIRSLKERPKLTFIIGIIIYIAVKLIAFGTYYTPLSISQMPPMLKFTGAYYFYAIGIAVLALAIQKLLKKHNPEMNIVLEYIIFAVIDIQVTNMLFATYMV